jgi:hypothetical protein
MNRPLVSQISNFGGLYLLTFKSGVKGFLKKLLIDYMDVEIGHDYNEEELNSMPFTLNQNKITVIAYLRLKQIIIRSERKDINKIILENTDFMKPKK